MMKELYDLCDKLKGEIRMINTKGDISPTELERTYKAVDIIKDIKTIEAMEDYSDDEYSGRRYYYDDDMKYARDRSYRRDGRYMSRNDGYSGHEDKEEMIRQIEEMKKKLDQM
jgi:hypothetical protein